MTVVLADRASGDGVVAPPGGRHLLHVFPSFAVGGVPLRICTIINHFAQRYRHTIIALDGNTAARKRLRPDLAVAIHPVTVDKKRPLRTLWQARAVLRHIAPDLLLTYNWGAIEWGLVNLLLPVSPHVHLESGFGPEEADGQVRRRVLFRRVALARARRLIVPSQTLVTLAREHWGIAPGKIQLIPNGVDWLTFAAAPRPGVIAGFTKRPGELIVGALAPLRPEKNLARLIRAFAALPAGPPVRLLLVGEGSERANLADLADRLGARDRVVFAGNIDAPEHVLGWFDLFALSSDTEQMPNSLIQAMAAGLAVAGVAVGDVGAIVAPANRPYIVPKGDSAPLRDAIAHLLAHADLRRDIGRDNQRHVRRHYDQQAMFAAYGEVFDALLPAATWGD